MYVLTWEDSFTQHVGETSNELHIRENLHRRGKTGCQHTTDHFNSCCKNKSYSIQIIKVLSGNGHDENGFVDENIRKLRLGRKSF